jgi:hypothetical protein
MEKALGQNDYVKLVEWTHPRDPKLKYAFTRFPGSNGEEDGVSVCPIVKKNGKAHVMLATHLRPQRLESKKSQGLSLEIVAGFNKDKEAEGHSTDENAKKETQEEMGLKIKELHRIPDAVGGASGSRAEYVAECETPKEVKPQEPDMTELAIMSVPLEDAINYISEASKKGIDIQDCVYKSIAEAQKIFNVKPSKKTKVKHELEWTIAGNNPNELQKDGLKLLAQKKNFIPEAAQEKLQKKKGFFAKAWNKFKYIITFNWLFKKT